jgi:hypothetical protein
MSFKKNFFYFNSYKLKKKTLYYRIYFLNRVILKIFNKILNIL